MTHIVALDEIKVLLGKSCHSAAILATPQGSYFKLPRQGSYLNEWRQSQSFPFKGHLDIKTARTV